MPKPTMAATLTVQEKTIIKALLGQGWRNQDIQSLINTGRHASINSGRISSIKKSNLILAASNQQVEAFRRKKLLFDHVTGPCPFDDERLVRAREAMLLAVELFNTPRITFKTGIFAMLVNVAWTYLLHEHFDRKSVEIINKEGHSISLSQMVERNDFPLSNACKKNLLALKKIRDVVEHRVIGPFDRNWHRIFQSNCLNFEHALTMLFGSRLSLSHDLGFTLQFSKLSIEEIAVLQTFDVPEHIASLDTSLISNLQEGEADSLEYQFKVAYTLTSASKSKAHFQFIQPDSAEGKDIQNVLIKYKPKADIYPLKPKEVIEKVRAGSGRDFTSDSHQKAWKKFQARPRTGASDPAKTNEEFCTYHPAFKSYTYSNAWVTFLLSHVAKEAQWQSLKIFK